MKILNENTVSYIIICKDCKGIVNMFTTPKIDEPTAVGLTISDNCPQCKKILLTSKDIEIRIEYEKEGNENITEEMKNNG